ncbi:MAG: Cna B-type domain-containing protein, partial [Erysipelotrichaceae bacterium]|nr:Cna B-type domain-containing protein [Erysipelotrichaceae bacterium]
TNTKLPSGGAFNSNYKVSYATATKAYTPISPATNNDNKVLDTTVTNTHTPEKIKLNVSKTWTDGSNQDGIRPTTVTFKIIDATDATSKIDTGKTIVLSAGSDNIWQPTELTKDSVDLFKYKNTGTLIVYELEEEATTVITGTDGVGTYKDSVTKSATNAYQFTAENTHTPDTVTLSVSKTWTDGNNQDGIRPTSLTFKIYDATDANNKINTGKTIVLSAGTDGIWQTDELSGTSVALPKYKGTGTLIIYELEEVKTTVITGTDKAEEYAYEVTKNSAYSFTSVNTHTPETVTLSVSKTWTDGNNQDGIRPTSLTFKIYDVTDASNKIDTGKTIDLSAGTDGIWQAAELSGTSVALPKYKGAHTEIIYSLEEVTDSVITGTDKAGEYAYVVTKNSDYNFTSVNTHTPEKTKVAFEKIWDDGNNRDGIRPTSITINLYNSDKDPSHTTALQTKTLTASGVNGTWLASDLKGEFTNLEKYDYSTTPIDYVIEEVKDTTITGVDGITTYSINITSDTSVTDGIGYKVTNKHTSQVTNVKVTKAFVDDSNRDGFQPTSVQVQLYKDGVAEGSPVTLDKNTNNWTYTWSNIDKYRLDPLTNLPV